MLCEPYGRQGLKAFLVIIICPRREQKATEKDTKDASLNKSKTYFYNFETGKKIMDLYFLGERPNFKTKDSRLQIHLIDQVKYTYSKSYLGGTRLRDRILASDSNKFSNH